MNTYVIQFDLSVLSARLSRALGCDLSIADVREFLQNAGFVESPRGWLTSDLRPLALVYAQPTGTLF